MRSGSTHVYCSWSTVVMVMISLSEYDSSRKLAGKTFIPSPLPSLVPSSPPAGFLLSTIDCKRLVDIKSVNKTLSRWAV